MKRIKEYFLLSALALSIFIGCGTSQTTDGTEENLDYLKNLESNCYYVRHENNECEKTYFGYATFTEGEVVTSSSDNRVMWFKEDFENIPTLYKGDSLIYCTEDELLEEFTFERFEDFGYSIGICGLTETPSGRYMVSTNPDHNNTYPNGDTDEILLFENKTVIIDTLGGKSIRGPVLDEYGEVIKEGDVTRCGSIKGLETGNSYKAEVYEGTYKNEYVFRADVYILGSMEVIKSTNYSFESEKIINIKIPETFNTGYYMIDGVGLFRYVNGDSYDEKTDFNISNEVENITEKNPTEENQKEENEEITALPEITITEVFMINEAGNKKIIVEVAGKDNINQLKVSVIDPLGNRYDLELNKDRFEAEISIETVGEYTVQIENVTDPETKIEIVE